MIYNFLNRYKECCKILQNQFSTIIKNEVDENDNHNDCDEFSEPEIQLENLNIKYEDSKDEILDFVDVNHEEITIKKISKKPKGIKKKKRIKIVKNVNIKTNSVASSVLEGVYTWTGENWWYVFNKLENIF